MEIWEKKVKKIDLSCSCGHPVGPDGLHVCRVSSGLTHDYCCQVSEAKVFDHCTCRIQRTYIEEIT